MQVGRPSGVAYLGGRADVIRVREKVFRRGRSLEVSQPEIALNPGEAHFRSVSTMCDHPWGGGSAPVDQEAVSSDGDGIAEIETDKTNF
jgi:hypothetical protein